MLKKPAGKSVWNGFLPHLNGGKGTWIWVSASLLYDSSGNVTGAIETVRDMTEVQKIRHDLCISREMNRGFANMIPVGIYEMDLSGTLTFANQVAFSWFGITQEDFDKKICILDYIVPEDRDRAFADIRRMMGGEKGTGQEYLLRRKDGSTFPGLIYGGMVMDPDTGKVIGLRGIIIDQTRRKTGSTGTPREPGTAETGPAGRRYRLSGTSICERCASAISTNGLCRTLDLLR